MIPLSRAGVICGALLLLSVGQIATGQEIVIGGEAGFSTGVRGDLLNGGEPELVYDVELSPILSVYGDTLEFRSQVTNESS